MKKLLKFIVLPIMLLSCVFLVSACQKPEDKIAIHTPFKTVYYVGEDLDVTGGILNYTKDGKTNPVAITSNMVTGFTTATAGTYNMVITYQDLAMTLEYTINEIPALTLNTSLLYKSAWMDDIMPGGGYYYLHFNTLNSVCLNGNNQNHTSSNIPSQVDRYPCPIISKQFIDGKWVITAYDTTIPEDNRITLIVTVQSNTQLHVKMTSIYSDGLEFDMTVC